MPIYTIAEYRVRRSGAERVKRAIKEFVRYVTANEPGTRTYLAWQRKDDPTRFVHFFIFEDEAAHKVHGGSEKRPPRCFVWASWLTEVAMQESTFRIRWWPPVGLELVLSVDRSQNSTSLARTPFHTICLA